MPIKSIAVTCMLAPAYWVVISVPSLASPICWIDRIAKAEGGINVYFIEKAVLSIRVMDNSGGSFTASNGVVHDEARRARDYLFVRDGVEFYASQMAHDTCSYRVNASEAVGKLTAKSVMNLPGLPPVVTTQMIGTDGAVSQMEVGSPKP